MKSNDGVRWYTRGIVRILRNTYGAERLFDVPFFQNIGVVITGYHPKQIRRHGFAGTLISSELVHEGIILFKDNKKMLLGMETELILPRDGE